MLAWGRCGAALRSWHGGGQQFGFGAEDRINVSIHATDHAQHHAGDDKRLRAPHGEVRVQPRRDELIGLDRANMWQ